MGMVFTLVVPPDKQTSETIDEYYEHYLDRLGGQLGYDSIEEISEYRAAKEGINERGDFMVWKKMISPVRKQMNPTPTEVYDRYAEASVIYSQRGLGTLVRAFSDVRERFQRENDLDEHFVMDIDQYIVLFDFALLNGFGVSYD